MYLFVYKWSHVLYRSQYIEICLIFLHYHGRLKLLLLIHFSSGTILSDCLSWFLILAKITHYFSRPNSVNAFGIIRFNHKICPTKSIFFLCSAVMSVTLPKNFNFRAYFSATRRDLLFFRLFVEKIGAEHKSKYYCLQFGIFVVQCPSV